MKSILTAMAALMLVCSKTQAGLFTETFSDVNRAIPDGSLLGVAITGNVSGIPSDLTVSGLTIALNISGGYNGNLFAYLVSPNGVRVTLMNQPGVSDGNPFGATGPGMNITLSDAGSTSIQSVTSSSVLSGTYSAAESLSGFNGSSANGTWTLFFADEASGGGTSTLNSWSLGITAVPEPVNIALGVFGTLFGGFVVVRQTTRWHSQLRKSKQFSGT